MEMILFCFCMCAYCCCLCKKVRCMQIPAARDDVNGRNVTRPTAIGRKLEAETRCSAAVDCHESLLPSSFQPATRSQKRDTRRRTGLSRSSWVSAKQSSPPLPVAATNANGTRLLARSPRVSRQSRPPAIPMPSSRRRDGARTCSRASTATSLQPPASGYNALPLPEGACGIPRIHPAACLTPVGTGTVGLIT